MVSYEVLEAMEKYGGSFAKNLAKLYWSADRANKKRIEECFSDVFKEYEKFVGGDEE